MQAMFVAFVLSAAAAASALPTLHFTDFQLEANSTASSCSPAITPMKNFDPVEYFKGPWWMVDTVNYRGVTCFKFIMNLQGERILYHYSTVVDGQTVTGEYEYVTTSNKAVWTASADAQTSITMLDTDYKSYTVLAVCRDGGDYIIEVESRQPKQVDNVAKIQAALKKLGFDMDSWTPSDVTTCPKSDE